MPESTQKVAKGSVSQTVWAGDIDALRSLVKQLETLAEYVREKTLGSSAANAATRRAQWDAQYSFYSASEKKTKWSAAEAKRQEEIREACQLRMRIDQRRWAMEIAGTPAEVLDEIDDLQDVRRVQLYLAGRSGRFLGKYHLEVDLDSDKAFASFAAPEPEFIDLAGTRLKAEFRRQRPWSWWFRATWAMWIYFVPGLIGGLSLTSLLIDQRTDPVLALAGQIILSTAITLGGYFGLRALTPSFELAPSGAKTRGIRRFAIIGAIVLWIAGTVVIPITLTLTLQPAAPPQSPSPSASPTTSIAP